MQKPYSFPSKHKRNTRFTVNYLTQLSHYTLKAFEKASFVKNKPNHSTMVKCERSFASLVENKMSSKDLIGKRAKCRLSGILHMIIQNYLTHDLIHLHNTGSLSILQRNSIQKRIYPHQSFQSFQPQDSVESQNGCFKEIANQAGKVFFCFFVFCIYTKRIATGTELNIQVIFI